MARMIDVAIRGASGFVDFTGRGLRLIQTGNLQTYAFLMALGVAVVLLILGIGGHRIIPLRPGAILAGGAGLVLLSLLLRRWSWAADLLLASQFCTASRLKVSSNLR